MNRIFLPLLLIALAIPALAQTEPQTATQTSVTCCKVRVDDVIMHNQLSEAVVVVHLIDSNGKLSEERRIAVNDGEPFTRDPATGEYTQTPNTADDLLWGTGLNGQALGLMRRIGSYLTDETGTNKARYQKAIIRWLQATGKLAELQLTIP